MMVWITRRVSKQGCHGEKVIITKRYSDRVNAWDSILLATSCDYRMIDDVAPIATFGNQTYFMNRCYLLV